MTRYPGANDLTGESGDAQTQSEGQLGFCLYVIILIFEINM